uniref:Suckerin-5 n=1 Tax=Acanthosepion esculentum TaxID=31210 RepID=A0A081DUA3_ACAES
MATITALFAFIAVLQMSCSVSGLFNGAWGSLGTSHYGYRYPSFAKSVSSISHGAHYPAYTRWRYSPGMWGHGLSGWSRYSSYYPASSTVSHIAHGAHYPIEAVAYNTHYPVGQTISSASHGAYQPFAWGYSHGSYGLNNLATSSASHSTHGIHQPIAWRGLYGLHYPATTTVSQSNHGVVNPISWGYSHGGLYGGYGFNYPAATSVSHAIHGNHQPVAWGAHYGLHYPAVTNLSQASHGIVSPISWGYSHGGLYGGYGFHYPTSTLGHTSWGHSFGAHSPFNQCYGFY